LRLLVILVAGQDVVKAMSSERSDYISYLLRLWRERGAGSACWRASLECSLTGKRHLFANMEQLFAFVRRQTDVRPTESEVEEQTRRQ
jgi:hypothetical protein